MVSLLLNYAASKCPEGDAIWPCTCFDEGLSALLICQNKNLNDSQASEILNIFLSQPPPTTTERKGPISPLGYVEMQLNKLTRIPIEMKKNFPHFGNVGHLSQ